MFFMPSGDEGLPAVLGGGHARADRRHHHDLLADPRPVLQGDEGAAATGIVISNRIDVSHTFIEINLTK